MNRKSVLSEKPIKELCEICDIEIFEYGKENYDFKIVNSVCPRCGRKGKEAVPIFKKVKA